MDNLAPVLPVEALLRPLLGIVGLQQVHPTVALAIVLVVITFGIVYAKHSRSKRHAHVTRLEEPATSPCSPPPVASPKVGTNEPQSTASNASTAVEEEEDSGDVTTSVPLPSDLPHFPFLSVTERAKCDAQQDAQTCGTGPEEVNAHAQVIPPNSRTPIPFENDLFVGQVLMIVRSDPEDPFYKPYLAGKSRQFEIRLQGKFKRAPKDGMVWMGGEVPKKMKLGLVTSGAARTLLAFVSSSALHYSFGSKDASDMPHLTCPLWQFAERLVVTPTGQTAQSITQEIVEDAQDRKARFRSKECPFPLDTQHTYTFSFHSQFVDVVKWKVVGVSALGKLNLGMFWNTMPLRFVMYDLASGPCRGSSKHRINDKNYFFCFSINNTAYARTDAAPLVEFGVANSDQANAQQGGAVMQAKGGRTSRNILRRKAGNRLGSDAMPDDNANIEDADTDADANADECSSVSSSGSSTEGDVTTSTSSTPVRHSRSSSAGTVGDRVKARLSSASIPGVSLLTRRRSGGATLAAAAASVTARLRESDGGMPSQNFKASKDTICVRGRVPGYVQAWDAEVRRVVTRLVLVCRDAKVADRAGVDRVWTVFRSPEAMSSILPNETKSGDGSGATQTAATAPAAGGKAAGALMLAKRLMVSGSRLASGNLLKRMHHASSAVGDSNGKPTPLHVLEGIAHLLDDAIQNDDRARRVGSKELPRALVMPHTVTDRSLLTCIDAATIGVRPAKNKCRGENLVDGSHVVMDAPVLRARWETCWREEWAVMSRVVAHGVDTKRMNLWFFMPGSAKPCVLISASALLRIRVVPLAHGGGKPGGDHSPKLNLNPNPNPNPSLNPNFLGIDECVSPLASVYPALELETIGEVHTIHFSDVATRDQWAVAIKASLSASATTTAVDSQGVDAYAAALLSPREPNLDDDDLTGVTGDGMDDSSSGHDTEGLEDEADDEEGADSKASTYHLPKDPETLAMYSLEPVRRWGAAKRVILNGRRMYYSQTGAGGSASAANANTSSEDAGVLVRNALRMAFALSRSGLGEIDRNAAEVSAFLDVVSRLKLVDVVGTLVEQAARASFYLNLYHTMLLHARLLVCQPASLYGWASFGSQMCYQIGADRVFSLAEVEHCLIRHSMACPTVLGFIPVSITSTPYAEGLGLTEKRPGLSLAINHMTMSELGCVPVYHPSTVWRQVDKYTAALILQEVTVKQSGSSAVITLPKLCQWYKFDFGRKREQRLLTVSQIVQQQQQSGGSSARSALARKLSEAVRQKCKVRYAKHVWLPHDVVVEME